MLFNFYEKQKREVDSSNKIEDLRKKFNESYKNISKLFNLEIDEKIDIELHFSISTLKENISLTYDSIQTFCAVDLEKKKIFLIHPDTLKVMSETFEKTYEEIINYSILKVFIYEIYEKKNKCEKTFMLNEILSKILSNNFQKKIIEFDIKNFREDSFYNNKRLLYMILYIIKRVSKENFIFEIIKILFDNLDTIKSLNLIFKKTPFELVKYYKDFLLEEDKKEKLIKGK